MKSTKKKKKSHHSNLSGNGSLRIKKRPIKKRYFCKEDSSTYSDASESGSNQDTRRHRKMGKEKKKHKKGKSKKSKRKECLSYDDDKVVEKSNKNDENIVRKEMGSERMLRPKDDVAQKPASSTSDLLEETPTKEVKEGKMSQHIESWRLRYKEGTGWCTVQAQRGEKIQDELKKMQEEVGESSIDEVECLKCASGERHGHGFTRGLGRKLRNESLFPNKSTSQSSNSQGQNTTIVQLVALSQALNQHLQEWQQSLNNSLSALNPNFQPPPLRQFHFDPSSLPRNTSTPKQPRKVMVNIMIR